MNFIFRDGDAGMSVSEKLITESQNELKYGHPKRALGLVTRYSQIIHQENWHIFQFRGLLALTELDALTYVSQGGIT